MLIFCKKNADIGKIKGVLVLKGICSKTKYVCVLMYQIQVSSIILKSFRQGENFTPPPSSQYEPLRSPPRLGLIIQHIIREGKGRIFIKGTNKV